MMKAGSLILGLPLMAVPAWGQEVTLSDLNGATVQYGRVFQQTHISNGKTYNPKVYYTGLITIEDNTYRASFQVTSIHPDGRKNVGPWRGGKIRTLGIPFKGKTGDDYVFIFADGILTGLAVYTAAGDGGAGGSKLSIEFKREPAGLTCSFSHPTMRETGVGEIRKNAATNGKPIQIIQRREISSNCTVARRPKPLQTLLRIGVRSSE
jgi:hypothetical protein